MLLVSMRGKQSPEVFECSTITIRLSFDLGHEHESVDIFFSKNVFDHMLNKQDGASKLAECGHHSEDVAVTAVEDAGSAQLVDLKAESSPHHLIYEPLYLVEFNLDSPSVNVWQVEDRPSKYRVEMGASYHYGPKHAVQALCPDAVTLDAIILSEGLESASMLNPQEAT